MLLHLNQDWDISILISNLPAGEYRIGMPQSPRTMDLQMVEPVDLIA